MTEAQIPPLSTSIHAAVALLEKDPDGGRLMMAFHDGQWVAGLEWGREDPDSDMVGAAAYGVDKVAAAALAGALQDAGL